MSASGTEIERLHFMLLSALKMQRKTLLETSRRWKVRDILMAAPDLETLEVYAEAVRRTTVGTPKTRLIWECAIRRRRTQLTPETSDE